VVVRGEVRGDLLIVGGNVRLESHVTGNIRGLAGNLELTSTVGRNVLLAGGTVVIAPSAHILGHLTVAAGSLELRGAIDEGIRAVAGQATLASSLNGPVELWLERQATLIVEGSAIVGDQFIYHASRKANISQRAKFNQAPIWKPLEISRRHAYSRGWWLGQLGSLFGALVLGMIVTNLWPKKLQAISNEALVKPWPSLGWGLAWALGAPLVSLILLVTIIGIPIAIAVLALFILGIVTSQVLAGAIVAQAIFSRLRFKGGVKLPLVVSVGLGIVIFRLLGLLPWLGGIWLVLGAVLGWGAIIIIQRKEVFLVD